MSRDKRNGLAILALATCLVATDLIGVWDRYRLGQRLDAIETHHSMDAENEWREDKRELESRAEEQSDD